MLVLDLRFLQALNPHSNDSADHTVQHVITVQGLSCEADLCMAFAAPAPAEIKCLVKLLRVAAPVLEAHPPEDIRVSCYFRHLTIAADRPGLLTEECTKRIKVWHICAWQCEPDVTLPYRM